MNDITRVFPTHPFFRQLNGVGQRSLYAVLKAYSNKDTQTGYCQGMGFVAGLCLLHMPEQGRREHCLEALSLLLAGLQRRGLRCVTLSELAQRASSPHVGGAPPDARRDAS